MSGWWFSCSASSATRFTNAIAAGKVSKRNCFGIAARFGVDRMVDDYVAVYERLVSRNCTTQATLA